MYGAGIILRACSTQTGLRVKNTVPVCRSAKLPRRGKFTIWCNGSHVR